MNERWRQVERLYHDALGRGAEGRAAFLSEACAGDEELRREVESLLGYEGRAADFIESPALEVAARSLAAERGAAAVAAGQMVGRYEIVSPLGAGGMGEVYLATDTRLGRKVALKLLPARFTRDGGRLRRFEQEARAVAALSHPNVCTIHEVFETDDGRRCIVMEHVEGETLRPALSGRRPDVKKALGLAAQVADGLAAAHRAGVIHRDIKPDNLMVTAGGQVKILDFGLAKLVEQQPAALFDSGLTAADLLRPDRGVETVGGVILGTVSYMSPEQAEGRALDQRTDIFSLGVVLYEMLTGERPFKGDSAIETLHAIIREEPPRPSLLNPRLPAEAEDILDKALAKDPEQRYYHARDFALDLRRLGRAMESGALAGARSREVAGPRSRRAALARAAAVASLVAAVALAAWTLGRSGARTEISPARSASLAGVTLAPLTTDAGYEGDPTFSPDGETIAYTSDRTGDFEIFIKQISGGPDVNITNNAADDAQPAFSPDGKQIAFVSSRSGPSGLLYFGYDLPLMGGDVWVMPALGGGARRIAEGGNFPSWSPDGASLIYASGPQRRQKILRVAASGGAPAEVPLKFNPGEPPPRFLLYPTYSSDGRWILFAAESVTAHTVYAVAASGGEPRRVVQGRRPLWGADSASVIYTNDERGRNHSLWRVPFDAAQGRAAGEASPLTVGRGQDTQATVSRDGRSIVFTAQQLSFNLEVTPFDAERGRATGAPQPVTAGNDVIYFMNFSPDGLSVAFESHRGNNSHLWRLDRGAAPVRLTGDPFYDDHLPRWSPDGRLIAFMRRPSNDARAANSLWVMAADGANPQPVVEGTSFFSHSWTPDGRGLVYFSPRDGQIYSFDLATKESRRLTGEPHVSFISVVSPDAEWLIFQSTLAGNIDLRAIPLSGGESRSVVATPHQDFHPFLSPSGRWLYFQLDHKNLHRVPGPAQNWRPAAPEKVTNFPESGLFLEDPQISRDGSRLLYARGRITGDLWIMNLGK
jgi:eukaryotic-like serine/threonine-protein kinase